MGSHSPLRPGDIVEVRPAAEIIATLDERGMLEAIPFMPEMLQHIGRRFVVAKSVEKICDTISGGYGSRRMRNVVFLEQLRCDGAGHGGCQAECRLYWKEAWLKKVDSLTAATAEVRGDERSRVALEHILRRNAVAIDPAQTGAQVFRCQATEALRATTPLSSWELGQYLRELTTGNVGLGNFVRVGSRALAWELARVAWRFLGQRRGQQGSKPAMTPAPRSPLGLKPGDWVEVRSAAEIMETLGPHYRNKGLSFATAEMLPACGKRFRVRCRIERIVDESTGRLLTLRNDCVALEGFVCKGDRSSGRYFCAREIYPYWREAWLRRVAEPAVVSNPQFWFPRPAVARLLSTIASSVRHWWAPSH